MTAVLHLHETVAREGSSDSCSIQAAGEVGDRCFSCTGTYMYATTLYNLRGLHRLSKIKGLCSLSKTSVMTVNGCKHARPSAGVPWRVHRLTRRRLRMIRLNIVVRAVDSIQPSRNPRLGLMRARSRTDNR